MKQTTRIVDSEGDPFDFSGFTPDVALPVTIRSVKFYFDETGEQVLETTLEYLHGHPKKVDWCPCIANMRHERGCHKRPRGA
jgi:hypothetical protein